MNATFLTPRQVAERWGCSARQVRRLCASGELRAMRLGLEAWRIAVAEVEAYEQRQTTATAGVALRHEMSQPKEVRAPVAIDGFTLPDGYEPVFPELWWEQEMNRAASSAAGRGRATGKKKATLSAN